MGRETGFLAVAKKRFSASFNSFMTSKIQQTFKYQIFEKTLKTFFQSSFKINFNMNLTQI